MPPQFLPRWRNAAVVAFQLIFQFFWSVPPAFQFPLASVSQYLPAFSFFHQYFLNLRFLLFHLLPSWFSRWCFSFSGPGVATSSFYLIAISFSFGVPIWFSEALLLLFPKCAFQPETAPTAKETHDFMLRYDHFTLKTESLLSFFLHLPFKFHFLLPQLFLFLFLFSFLNS